MTTMDNPAAHRHAEQRPIVLVVDDNPINLNVAADVLEPHYQVLAATSGSRALDLFARTPPPPVCLVLMDVMMPGMDGYTACRSLKANRATAPIPVIFLTALDSVEDERRGFDAGGVDFIAKPFRPETLLARVATHLRLHAHERHLDSLVAERTVALAAQTKALEEKSFELEATRLQVIHQLGRAAEFKDDDTGTHVIRMAHYSRLIAEAAGMDSHRVEVIYQASPMHDIGKLGIPDAILKKPGRLTPEEFAVMKRHPEIGAGIIGSHRAELLETARVIALSHHEKWSGGGYPLGLTGTTIPVEGRIAAIADVFDALTSARPYKPAWSVADAIAEMQRGSGTHFDPTLFPLFLERLPEVIGIKERYNPSLPPDLGLPDAHLASAAVALAEG